MSEGISINIDLSKFDLPKYSKKVSTAANKAIQNELWRVISQAKKVHRYHRKTGTLRKSVQKTQGTPYLTAEAHLDTGEAFYGPYVHEGHGTHDHPAPGNYVWDPDQFLYAAFISREEIMSANIQSAIDEAIRLDIYPAEDPSAGEE
jgi:hypothetical protein